MRRPLFYFSKGEEDNEKKLLITLTNHQDN